MYYLDGEGNRVYTLKVGRGGAGRSGSAREGACMPAAPQAGPRQAGACCPHQGPALCSLSHSSANFFPPAHIRVRPPQKTAPDGTATQSAHPARFSPDDKFSRERTTCKRRFGLLPTQQLPREY